MSTAPPSIPWPPELTPEKTPVYSSHELWIAAPTDLVWRWLVSILRWPQYATDVSGVVPLDLLSKELALGAAFQWRCCGYTLLSVVTDYLPYARLGWTIEGLWLRGFQEWILIADGDGCRVRVEETLAGAVPWFCRRQALRILSEMQRHWLESLRDVAESGPPPM